MKQTKFLLSADWHIRGDKPRCRLDEDWKKTQEDILDFIFNLSAQYKADIIHTGDLFNSSQEPDWVKFMLLDKVNRTREDGFITKMFLIAGNHELPFHNFENVNRSSFGVVYRSGGNIYSLNKLGLALHFGLALKYDLRKDVDKVFIHKLTYKNNIPPYIKNAVTAQELLDIFKDSKYIITGDNHKKFIYENKGRYVINPGCIIRQKHTEIEYEPSVYLIDFETEEIEEIKIPDKVEMVTDEYVIDSSERDERIRSFVELVKNKKGLTLSFKESLLNKLKEDNEEIEYFKDIIEEIMEEVYGNNNTEI